MANAYPLSVFHFKVQFGGADATFAEASGLTVENQVIEYQTGESAVHSTIKMPGIPKWGNITLKRGIMAADNGLYEWFATTALNKIQRRDVTISMLNELHEPIVTWNIINCWPVKVEGPGLKASGNEVAMETIELAHEGLVLIHN